MFACSLSDVWQVFEAELKLFAEENITCSLDDYPENKYTDSLSERSCMMCVCVCRYAPWQGVRGFARCQIRSPWYAERGVRTGVCLIMGPLSHLFQSRSTH